MVDAVHPSPREVWRGLDRSALDRAYNNAAAVANSAQIVARWEERSAALRQRRPATLDLRYGLRPRQRVDFLSAGAGTPTLVFVHGGYWQMRSKENFTFVAEGPLARGISVALVGYTLAPENSLDGMVEEIRTALDWLTAELPRLGGDPDRIWHSGWSAGGHLVAMTLDHPAVGGGLAISGIYDLEPIRHCYVNEKLGLDAAAAARNSPVHHIASGSKRLDIAVGGAELPLMIGQSKDYAAARSAAGLPGAYEIIADADHFTILDELARPDGTLTRMAEDLIGLR